ncbi:MAG: recombinase family protein [Nitrososphaerota archaeon]
MEILSNEKQKRAAIYIRLSSEEQAKEGYSPQTQREKALEFARNNGFKVSEKHIYEDLGYSGGTDKRPGLQKLLKDAQNKEFDVVVVYRLDRFFRNLRLLINTAYELRKLGIGLISVTEPFDTSTPTGRAMLYSLGTFAEWQREVTLEARNEGMVKAVKDGKWVGSGIPPYGYDFDTETQRLKINEDEAKVVRMVFSWLANDGLNIYQIQKRLNEMRIPTKFDGVGKKKKLNVKCWWHQTTVYRMLTREMYTGVYWWRKYKKPNRSRRKIENLRPREEWVLVKVPAIISRELFEKAQERLSENKAYSRKTKVIYLFRGKLVCGFDGRKYRSAYRKPKTPRDSGTIYYICPNRSLNQSPTKCNAPSIAESRLEVVWENLKEFLTNPRKILDYLKEYKERELDGERTQEKLRAIEKKLLRLKEKEERLLKVYSEGLIDFDIYRKHWEECKREEDLLLSEKYKVLQMNMREEEKKEKVKSIKTLYDLLKEKIENATKEIKYQLIQRLVERIIVKGDELEVIYNLPLKRSLENIVLENGSLRCYNEGFSCENVKFYTTVKLLPRSEISKRI